MSTLRMSLAQAYLNLIDAEFVYTEALIHQFGEAGLHKMWLKYCASSTKCENARVKYTYAVAVVHETYIELKGLSRK